MFVSGILSALFVNDTICLVFTPVLIELARARGHRPLPYLLALATGANIGSVATITGNPQNMLIASLSQIRYGPFLAALGPVALSVWRSTRSSCRAVPRRSAAGSARIGRAAPRPIHRVMTIKGLVVTAFVLIAFLLGKDPAIVAAIAAAALLITRRVNPQKIYRQIDWDLLVLFIGLFVVIGGVERVGLAQRLFDLLRPVGLHTIAGLSIVTTIVSNVISNVPAVMLLSRLVPQLPDPHTSWLTLAMSSTLAGNLTLRRLDRQPDRPRRRASARR